MAVAHQFLKQAAFLDFGYLLGHVLWKRIKFGIHAANFGTCVINRVFYIQANTNKPLYLLELQFVEKAVIIYGCFFTTFSALRRTCIFRAFQNFLTSCFCPFNATLTEPSDRLSVLTSNSSEISLAIANRRPRSSISLTMN